MALGELTSFSPSLSLWRRKAHLCNPPLQVDLAAHQKEMNREVMDLQTQGINTKGLMVACKNGNCR